MSYLLSGPPGFLKLLDFFCSGIQLYHMCIKLLNDFFTHGQHVLLPCLHSLLNKLLISGYFPSSWSEGYIIPLHKKEMLITLIPIGE